MKYPRTLLKTLAILGPMAVALSSCAAEPAHAQAYNWCNTYYDPSCAYPYPYGPYAYDPYAYPYPSGGAFFFFGDRHRDHHFDHHFDHGGGFHHGGFGHGGYGHGGMMMMGHGGGGHGGGHGH